MKNDFSEIDTTSLIGKTALITGSSRGVGAEVAKILASLGVSVVVNYRQKAVRAKKVVDSISESGGIGAMYKADLTVGLEVDEMLTYINSEFNNLNILVLNASGGMESGMSPGYALALNRDAQVDILCKSINIMPPNSRVIFVTSHQAHFINMKDTLPEYEPVAKSKRAGEDSLRELIPLMNKKNIKLVIVSGDIIEGTVTAMLLDRNNPGMLEARKREVGELLSVESFAKNIVQMCISEVKTGHTEYAGGYKGYEKYLH